MIYQFQRFAEAHGLIMDRVEIGKIVRTKTTDHPKKRNGAYQFMGDYGWVQNHATMPFVAIWFPDDEQGAAPYDKAKYEAIAKKVRADQAEARKKAVAKAGYILKACKMDQHAYFDKKGFPEMRGMVWYPNFPKEDVNLLCIPMRIGKELSGLQLIDRFGEKTFITGSKCSGAEFLIDGGGVDVWCEGYATGLSVHAVFKAALIQHKIHVCFSAGNMRALAKKAGKGIVIADHAFINKQTGTKAGHEAVKAIGLPSWMSATEGQDFNDYHQEVGTLKAAMEMRKFYNGLAIRK